MSRHRHSEWSDDLFSQIVDGRQELPLVSQEDLGFSAPAEDLAERRGRRRKGFKDLSRASTKRRGHHR
jgi:hypothetical protein